MFWNNKNIPLIPPLYCDNCFITDLNEKAELFNCFFSKQCSLISKNSSLPGYINYTTEKRLSTGTLSVKTIDKITHNLDFNKAHGHNNISIPMLKICGDSIYKPLKIIVRQALVTSVLTCETLFLFTKKWHTKY